MSQQVSKQVRQTGSKRCIEELRGSRLEECVDICHASREKHTPRAKDVCLLNIRTEFLTTDGVTYYSRGALPAADIPTADGRQASKHVVSTQVSTVRKQGVTYLFSFSLPFFPVHTAPRYWARASGVYIARDRSPSCYLYSTLAQTTTHARQTIAVGDGSVTIMEVVPSM